MLNNLIKKHNVSVLVPVHIVQAIEKMNKTLIRTQLTKNIILFKTDYLE